MAEKTCERAVFLEKLKVAIIVQRFSNQAVERTLNVLGKSLKTVLDEIHFIVNL